MVATVMLESFDNSGYPEVYGSWSTTNATLDWVSSPAQSGTGAVRLTVTAAGNATLRSPLLPISGYVGQTAQASMFLRPTSTPRTGAMWIEFFASGGGFLSDSGQAAVAAPTANVWTSASSPPVVVPAGAEHARVVYQVNTAGTGDQLTVDEARLDVEEVGSTPTGPLPMPVGLEISLVTSTSLRLTWDNVAGATGYAMYLDGVAVGGHTAIGASTSYRDFTGLTAGATYILGVEPVDANGLEGARATRAATTTAAAAAPVVSAAGPSISAWPDEVLLTASVTGQTGVSWLIVEQPAGSGATLRGETTLSPTLVPGGKLGQHTARITATNANGSNSSAVTVAVHGPTRKTSAAKVPWRLVRRISSTQGVGGFGTGPFGTSPFGR